MNDSFSPSGRLVLAALTPHPPIIVPEVGGPDTAQAQRTVDGMRRLAQIFAEARPDTIVVISPHGPVFSDVIAITGLPVVEGDLRQFGAAVSMEFSNDLALAEGIAGHAKSRGVSAAVIEPSFLGRLRASRRLDHGTMVPLYYISQAVSGFRVVPVAMGVDTPDRLYMFGMALREAVEEGEGRVALIASGDLSHRLKPGAPAGYSPEGKVFDERLVEALGRMDVGAIARLDDRLVEAAGECGLRPIFMMLGALDGLEVEGEVHSYEGPFGVGYAVASFRPLGAAASESARRYDDVVRALEEKRTRRRRSESPYVSLARQAVEEYVRHRKIMPAPEPLPEGMERAAGVFCSIHKGGQLRGCIGTTEPVRASIAEEIISNAISAAMRDPRFEPVEEGELDDLVFSVDVLSEPEPISGPDELDPARYGVIVRRGGRVGLLLPDLDGIDTVQEQVGIARRKAGIGEREPVELARFEVTRYE
ncbi:MAG: AmmeMemoRadiSam system protein A [Bacillota bacterium]